MGHSVYFAEIVVFAILIIFDNVQKWQEIWTKLNQMNANQLLEKLTKFDDSVLSGEQMDLAEKTFRGCNGRFHQCHFHKSLYEWVSILNNSRITNPRS